MKDAIEAAIKSSAEKASNSERSDDAMKYAQAALSLAHCLATLDGLKG